MTALPVRCTGCRKPLRNPTQAGRAGAAVRPGLRPGPGADRWADGAGGAAGQDRRGRAVLDGWEQLVETETNESEEPMTETTAEERGVHAMTDYDYRITVDIDTTDLVTAPEGGQLTELLEAVRSALEDAGLSNDEFEVAGADAPVADDGPSAEWLIWSHEHGLWWAPSSCGYRSDLAAAGRYSRADADYLCSLRSWAAWDRPPEVMVSAPPADLLGRPELDRVMRARLEAATAEAIALRSARRRSEVVDHG